MRVYIYSDKQNATTKVGITDHNTEKRIVEHVKPKAAPNYFVVAETEHMDAGDARSIEKALISFCTNSEHYTLINGLEHFAGHSRYVLNHLLELLGKRGFPKPHILQDEEYWVRLVKKRAKEALVSKKREEAERAKQIEADIERIRHLYDDPPSDQIDLKAFLLVAAAFVGYIFVADESEGLVWLVMVVSGIAAYYLAKAHSRFKDELESDRQSLNESIGAKFNVQVYSRKTLLRGRGAIIGIYKSGWMSAGDDERIFTSDNMKYADCLNIVQEVSTRFNLYAHPTKHVADEVKNLSAELSSR